MKNYGKNRLPKAPPPRRVERLQRARPASSLERTRGIVREHEGRERSFDPGARGSWRGSSRDLVVNRRRHARNASVSEKDLEEFMQGYLVCMLWSSNDESDESGGDPLDKNYSVGDIAQESFEQAMGVCRSFLEQYGDAIESAELSYNRSDGSKMEHAGHDFWLTRNGHGAGFWDGDWSEPQADILTEGSKKFGEVYPYVGDDGQVYVDDGYLIRGRMKQNPDIDDVPREMTAIDFRHHEPPRRSGASISYGAFSNGEAGEGEDQWYEVDSAGGSNQSGAVNRSNYNVLEKMLAEEHPIGEEPAVWATAYGGYGTFAIIVVWDRLSRNLKGTISALDEYPSIDDSALSELETEEQEEAWSNWARSDFEKELKSSLLAEFSEEDEEELENVLDELDDEELQQLFRIGSESSMEYWEQESDGGWFIRMTKVADAAVDVLMGREHAPRQSYEPFVNGLRNELGIKVK